MKNTSSRRVCIPLLLFVLKACDKVPGVNQQCTLKPPRRPWRSGGGGGVRPLRPRCSRAKARHTCTRTRVSLRSGRPLFISHSKKTTHALPPCELSTSISAGIFHPTCLIPAHSIFIQGCANVPRSQTPRDLMFCGPISRPFISSPLSSSYLPLTPLSAFYSFIYSISFHIVTFFHPQLVVVTLVCLTLCRSRFPASLWPRHATPEWHGKHLRHTAEQRNWAQSRIASLDHHTFDAVARK